MRSIRYHALAALVAFLLLCALGVTQLHAQSGATAAILGTVTDGSGSSVEGATIEFSDPATGLRATTLSDASGRFHLAGLRPGGPYTLVVTRLGWARHEREGLRLRAGETLRLAVVLTVQPVALDPLDVTVDAVDATFNPSNTGATLVIEPAVMTSLPTLERNVVDFAELSPLVRAEAGGFSIAGQNERYNSLRVDGALLQDVFGHSTSGVPGGEAGAKPIPLSAVEQYQIAAAPYDVRQSGFTGGLLNAVTRSGTNEWRTTMFGYFRNPSLLGSLDLDGIPVSTDGFGRTHAGFTLGGPLVQDRAHLFTAFEVERRRTPVSGYHVGASDPHRVRIHPDTAARVARILRDVYGAEAGAAGPLSLENPTHNLFTKLDLRPSDAHRLTLQHSLIDAERETAPNRESFNEFEFGSSGTRLESRTHALTLQWFATPGGEVSNELMLNVQHTRSRNRARSELPLLEFVLHSDLGDGVWERRARAGANFFAQADEVDQTVYQIVNDLSIHRGDHRLVVGGAIDYMTARQLHMPGAGGRFVFESLDALEAREPVLFERNITLSVDDDPSVDVSMLQVAAYLQHEWFAGGGLTLRSGVRLDVPTLLGRPEDNPRVERSFGFSNATLPGTQLLISPRLGFNWRPEFDTAFQLRGGAGIFTGRPPLAWLANAYASTGLRTGFLRCEGADAPRVPVGAPVPVHCADRFEAHVGPPTPPHIVLLDRDFRFPQELRTSLALDRRLPLGFSATVEWIYSRALRQVELRELNLDDPIEEASPGIGYPPAGFGERPHYGIPTDSGFVARRIDPALGNVIQLTNNSGNYSYAFSVELRRSVGEAFGMSAAYAYARSGDRQSLVASDAVTNLGLTPVADHVNDPPLRPSRFDQPHKVVTRVVGRLPERAGGGELTVRYVGQSGRPYSYVYQSDINGDGYPGDGLALGAQNDLLYVPALMSDLPAWLGTRVLLEGAIQLDACLQPFRGMILPRNHCRTPWSNRVDVRLRQPVAIAGRTLEWTADIANVLNLLNDEWGRVWHAAPVVPLLSTHREASGLGGLSPDDPLMAYYVGPTRPDRETGRARSALPWTLEVPASQWQVQIGLELRL